MTTTNRMPVLFAGHGSPMNAINQNVLGGALSQLGGALPRPQAIVVISAHWQTSGPMVVNVEKPQTIHDFYGFPEKLFKVEYPAPGAPALAKRIHELRPQTKLTRAWGLDHGAWSILIHLFPKADIPVLQLSLNELFTPIEHYSFAQGLKALRDEGVMIITSGNIVHNLRAVKWHGDQSPYPWTISFDEHIKKALMDRDVEKIINFEKEWPEEAHLSAPTPEHFLPLLYSLAVTDQGDQLSFPVEGYELGSLSMRSVLWR